MPCTQCQATSKTSKQRCKNRTCKQYPYCWIHLKSLDKLQIKKSTIAGAGEGLFYVGKKPFPKDKNVALYSSKQVYKTKPSNSNYVLQVSANQYIDGRDRSNFVGRYINSSKHSGKQSNVRFSKTTTVKEVKGRKAVPIVSTKKIPPKTELLLNYGKDYKIPAPPKTSKKRAKGKRK